VAADGETAYYAASGASTTKVEALPAGGGKPRWTATVRFGAARLRLTVVNGLLILDGQQSTLERDARAVVDARTGKVLWHKQWSDRFDLAYVGTDALVEVRERPTAVTRFDLRTGKSRWTVAGPDTLMIIDDHLAKAARTWPSSPTARRTGDPLAPPRGNGFPESLAAGTDVVVLDDDEARGKVVDGSTGKVRRSGALPLDAELWDVYEGLVIGKRNDSGGAAVIVAYRLSDLGKAWQFPLAAGSSVSAIRPCGPKRICVVAAPPGVSDDIVYAIDTTRGTKAWQRQPAGLIDVGWYVVDGKLVFGEDSFGSIGEPVVIDSANKVVREYTEHSTGAIASAGGRLLLRKVRLSGTTVIWQVAVADIGSGRVTGGVDLNADLPAGAALAGDTLVVLSAGAAPTVKVCRVSLG
jgi:outer membrane protein assembly factor BamB